MRVVAVDQPTTVRKVQEVRVAVVAEQIVLGKVVREPITAQAVVVLPLISVVLVRRVETVIRVSSSSVI
jgi:hypothetical protein